MFADRVKETTPNYAEVVDAAVRLNGVAHRTPVLTSRTADDISGGRIFFKCENFQRVGAFKFRGAYNAISRFDARQRESGVLAFSSGNHAQAVALSAKLIGMKATIVMPLDAPTAKLDATRAYGAEVVAYDRFRENREQIGKKLAEERDLTLIPPYDHPDVIAGQGTVVKELVEEVGELDYVLVPLGGGGLLGGSSIALSNLSPRCHIIGVEPESGNDGQQSLRNGSIVRIAVPETIADGAQTTFLGKYTFPIIQRYVSAIVTVSDAQLVATMRFFAERMKMVVEPTGCLAAAAVLQGQFPIDGKRAGIIISGGNIDLPRLAQLIRG
jgi:threo-3-hydroxy-L-aspartate ammonia-lyase